jgi:ArsR family transcriptional regulator
MIGLDGASEVLKTLGDPSRVRLLALLETEELTVAELTRITRLSQSRVSTHLRRLRAAGLVLDRPDGASTYYRASGARMPAEARALWEPLQKSARDPLLDEDRRRLNSIVRGRAGQRNWADTVAGRMERHYSPGRTWQATLRGLLPLIRLGDVLDIASGDCAIAELLAPRARRITCLDRSARVLHAGRERLGAAGQTPAELARIEFLRGDLHELPVRDTSFDQVLMLACLCYARDPERAVAEAARALKPGGALIGVALHAHRHRELVAKYDHIHLGFEPETIARACRAAGLTIETCHVAARERRAPHFETITFQAKK